MGLAADHRVATTSATFRLGVAPYGLSPVLMATTVLPTLLGPHLSTRMYVEDLTIDPRYAAISGLVDRLSLDKKVAGKYATYCAGLGYLKHSTPEMASIQPHTEHLVQETLLNAETSKSVHLELQQSLGFC